MLSELARLDSHEELGPWLHDALERLLDAIHRHRRRTPDALLHTALQFMRDHLAEDIGRGDAARAAHLSPAHFSRLFAKEVGRPFTDTLNQMRVDRAAELLAKSDKSLCLVALECGFRDQSYFTKVFRRHFRVTPRKYRLKSRRDADL
jgi:two-component system response regulator YesN